MQRRLTIWLPLIVLALLGVLAASGNILESIGFTRENSDLPRILVVRRSADRGPGSLRSAIFSAIKLPHHVTIQLDVEQIDLEVPLPPIATVHGVSIVGIGDKKTIISNNDIADDAAPVLHIVGSDITLRNFEIDAAGATAIAISGIRTELDQISVVNAKIAVMAVDVDQLFVHGSTFRNNFDGIHVEGRQGRVTVSGCTFEGNRNDSMWFVFSPDSIRPGEPINLHDNLFIGGRNNIVAAHSAIDLRGNRMDRFSGNGITLLSSWATIRGNRILDSRGIGMHLSALRDSFVVDNEIGRNALVGILVLDADGLRIDDNQLYANGYGIAAVGRKKIVASVSNNVIVDHKIDGLIAIGDTPFIADNHALRNRQAGIRILDLLLPDQPSIVASPRVDNNILDGNGDDSIMFGQYVVNQP